VTSSSKRSATVTAEITRDLDLTALLDLITRRAVDLVEAAEMGAVYLWDKTGEALSPPAWYGFGAWIRDLAIRPGEEMVGAVVQSRKGLLVNDYQSSPYAHPIIVQRTNATAVLAEPLLYHDRLIGVILLNNGTSRRPFTAQDQDLLTIFGAQAATAIEHTRLYEALENRISRLQTLTHLNQVVSSSLDIDAVLNEIAHAAALMDAPNVSFWLVDEATRTWRFVALPTRHSVPISRC